MLIEKYNVDVNIFSSVCSTTEEHEQPNQPHNTNKFSLQKKSRRGLDNRKEQFSGIKN